jgi:guanine nucleotide-binding protein G(I)/G(S)/G(T) subunit beta-1
MDNIADKINACRAHIDTMQHAIQDHVERAEHTPVLQQVAHQQGYKPPVDIRITQNRLLRGHYGKIYAMQWCPSVAPFLVSASQDGNLILWNAMSGNKIHAIPLRSAWVMSCSYSQTGQAVACGGLENTCFIYRLREAAQGSQSTGEVRINPSVELAGHDGYLSACRFIDDTQILTASGDSTCILWNIDRRSQLQTFHGHYGDVMSISVNDGSTFVSGSVDASVKLWDLRQRGTQSVKTFRGHSADVNSVQFFPDGNSFATGSDDSSCRLFDVRAVSQVNRYGPPSSNVGVTSVVFSHSGRILFSGYDDHNCVAWDTATGKQIGSLAHDSRVSCLGLNTDGKALCTGSWDAFLRIWC